MRVENIDKYFPQELLVRALHHESQHGWHIEDVPAVIEAARKADLITTICYLQVFIPDEIGGGICLCQGVQFITFEPFSTELPLPDKAAQIALDRFNELKSKYDFLEIAKEIAGPILGALGRPDANLQDMLGFVLGFNDGSPETKISPEKTRNAKLLEDVYAALETQSYQSARALVQTLAEKGNPVAQILMGGTYSGREGTEWDSKEQLKWYRMAAAQNHAHAWYLLHMRYMWGQDVEKDLSEAAMCLRRAAEQGHVMACSFLGDWYRNGTGVEKDDTEAFKWLQLAASYGRPESQGELGLMYLWGIGRTKNYEEAYFWLSLAVQSPWNYIYLPKRYEAARHLTPNQVEQVKKRLKEWKKIPLPPEANDPYFPTG
jgi:hypothetical protein